MTFLEVNEIWEWCGERGVTTDSATRLPVFADGSGQILEFGKDAQWDAYVIPARQGSVTDRRAFASHDEWLQIE